MQEGGFQQLCMTYLFIFVAVRNRFTMFHHFISSYFMVFTLLVLLKSLKHLLLSNASLYLLYRIFLQQHIYSGLLLYVHYCCLPKTNTSLTFSIVQHCWFHLSFFQWLTWLRYLFVYFAVCESDINSISKFFIVFLFIAYFSTFVFIFFCFHSLFVLNSLYGFNNFHWLNSGTQYIFSCFNPIRK